ncbi:dihydroorotase [Leifsonia poae]|uniref:dihydroorotase n=1 Tax=Leifsonia poae TaxID=110933 RepID=UPI001CBE4B80|nr:dihydroorotase [Leifsonia poae]
MRIENVLILGVGTARDIVIEGDEIVDLPPTAQTARPPRVALPGLVDLHSHLREPGGEGSETIASGTAAAAAGGFTDVFAMANTDPVTDTVARVLDVRRRAEGRAAAVHVVAAATVGLGGRQIVEVERLTAAGVTMFSDDGKCVADDDVMLDLLTRIARTDAVFAQHAQHPGIVGAGVINERVAQAAGAVGWPNRGEAEIVARDIAIVRATGARLHICHISTRETVELLAQAKLEGLPVTGEVTPHHLHLTDDDALGSGARLKVNPPLRSSDDVAALRKGLRSGVIDAVGTDHAPHPVATKALPWPDAAFGLTGLETAAAAVIAALSDDSGVTDWNRVVDALVRQPIRIGGLTGRLPADLAPGAPATLTVLSHRPAERVDTAKHLSHSQNAAFAGLELSWRVELTLREGRPTYRR